MRPLCAVNHVKIVVRVTFSWPAFWKRARFPREFSSFEVLRGFCIEPPVRPIRASCVRFRRSVSMWSASVAGRYFAGGKLWRPTVEIASMLVQTGPDHRICYVCRLVCNVVFTDAGWSSSVARWAHNPEVAGSNPVPATSEEVPEPEGSGTFFVSVGGLAGCGSDTANPQAVRGFRPRYRSPGSGVHHTIPTAGKTRNGQILFSNYESCAVVRTPKGILVIDHGAVA